MSSTALHFECIKCGACCKNQDLIVTLTGRDIVKIAISLGLNAEQILRAIDFYIQVKDDPLPKGLSHIPQVMTEEGLAMIALKKNEEGECIFLKDDLCMIHEIRPGACASFPFVFEQGNEGIKWGLSAMMDICPGLGKGPAVRDSDLLETAAKVLEELDIYREFVDDWNENSDILTAERILSDMLSDIRFIV